MPDTNTFQNLLDQDTARQPDVTDAAPPKSDPMVDFYNTYMSPSAQSKAVAGSVQDPSETAKNLETSAKTGIHPAVVAADPDAAQQAHRTSQASKYVGTNKYLQSYVNENPQASTVSNNDWQNLDSISKAFEQSGLVSVPFVGVFPTTSETMDALLNKMIEVPPVNMLTGIYNIAKSFMSHTYEKPPENMSQEEFYAWNQIRQQNEIKLGFWGGLVGLDVGAFPMQRFGGQSTTAQLREFLDMTGPGPVESRGARWRREIDEFLAKKDAASRPVDTALPEIVVKPDEIPEAPAEGSAEMLALPPPRPTTVTEQMVRAGQIPPTGIDPLVDKFHQALIKHDLNSFDQIFEMVQASDTYEKSREQTARYLAKITKDATVGIAREAIEQIYANKAPGPGDGLLGFDPNIAAKIATSRMSRSDVNILMSEYLAHIDPTVHGQISDDLRIRPDGITRNEARELETLDPNSIPQTLLQGIRKSFYFQPMFVDFKPPGLPAGMYTKYFNKIVKEGQARLDRIFKAHERDVKREMTPEWRANEKAMQEEVEMDMRYDPGFRADRYLRMGELPNRQKVTKLKLFQPALERYIKAGQASTKLRMYASPKGEQIDTVAHLLDFRSGAEMIRALNKFHQAKGDLQAHEYFDNRVKTETAARMRARYGDLPTKVYNETRDRALAEEQIDVFIDELYMINEAGKLGEMKPLTKQDLQAWAQDRINKARAYEVNYADYQRAAEKSGRDALNMALSQKWGESFKAKLEQAISTYMAKAAIAEEKKASKLETLINRYSYNRVVDGVKQEYTNMIHAIFDKVGLPQPRETAEVVASLRGVTLPQFVEAKRAAGWDPVVDQELISHEGYPFSEYTVKERDNFRVSIESLDRLGRIEATIQAGAQAMDFEVAKAQALQNLGRMPRNAPLRHPSKIQRILQKGYDIDATLVKPEQRIDWYDRNDPLGIFNQVMFMPLAKAKHVKDDMLRELGGLIQKLPGWQELKGRATEKLENNELVDWRSGQLRDLTWGDLLGIMLNMGNPGNFGKLTGKFEGLGRQVFQWDPMLVKAFVDRNATKEMWELAQGIWDIFEHFWPRMEELSYRVSGVPPEKVQPRPIQTRFGTFKGGYYPLLADPFWLGKQGESNDVFSLDRWFRSTPARDWEYARTSAQYPLDINFFSIVPKLEQFIHDIAFREPLINAWRFVSDTDIYAGIEDAWGQADAKQLKDWLKYVANGKVINDSTLAGWNYAAHLTRDAITSTQLLYRMSTVIKHGIAAAINSGAEVGVGKLAWNIMRLYMSPDGPRMLQEIISLSGEMRNRSHDLDRDIGEQYRRALGEGTWLATAKLYGGAMVAALDKASAFPTWYTVFEDAYIRQGLDKQEAIFMADKAVRNAHGASGIIDLPAIQRGNEIMRLFTIAYSFFSHNYNRIGNTPREMRFAIQDMRAGQENDARAQATAKMFRRMFGAALKFFIYTTVTGMAIDAVRERWKREGETATDAIWRHAATGTVTELLGTLPWARDFAQPLTRGKLEPYASPFHEVMQTVMKVVPDLYQDYVTKETRRSHVRDYITALGYTSGIPGMGQLAASAQYYFDQKEGIQPSEGFGDKFRGYTFGRADPDEPPRIPRGRSTRFHR